MIPSLYLVDTKFMPRLQRDTMLIQGDVKASPGYQLGITFMPRHQLGIKLMPRHQLCINLVSS